jgi:GNAT superfamily N-acetyltransferase
MGVSHTGRRRASEYIVRPFEEGDREPFLSLFKQTFTGVATDEWFDWRYVDNPYLDHVPIFVAERDGELAGARPYLAFEMQVDDDRHVALQTCDTMVHPDHRRQGLFTRMTERSVEFYATREPAFTFNVPNALSRPGYLKLGWQVVGDLTTYYRVQHPRAMIGDASGAMRYANSAATVASRGYLGARDRLLGIDRTVTVERYFDVPVATLAALYRTGPPDGIHAVRDERFYGWRFRNPNWSYETYVASRSDGPVAAAVVGSRTMKGVAATYLTDVVPMAWTDARREALEVLLARIVADHADADVLAFCGEAVPHRTLRAFGFLPDDRLPLSLAASPTVLVSCPLDGTYRQWEVDGRPLDELTSWSLAFCEQNTA